MRSIEDKKDKVVNLRLSEQDRIAMNVVARYLNMNISEMIRYLVQQELDKIM